ncbi:MAG: endonuclease Q family protein [Methanomicrobiales archaeon]|nr:endonuclease Q family protein [Methanomicrobiales archaeon]
MQVNADLHIHSPFSIASSRDMVPARLREGCRVKGLHVLGSGDGLHPAWRRMWQEESDTGSGILVLPTGEVEDRDRVHHLILLESWADFEELGTHLETDPHRLRTSGRPRVNLGGEAIAGLVHSLGGLVGPAHAFTPWTSLFASFDRVAGCYGSEPIDFLELGLSADSSYGAGISELRGVPFLTNSDAHSPSPVRLGREFTRLQVRDLTCRGVLEAIRKGAVVMNAGFFPEEGKYNRTACTRCFRQYTREEAEALKWRCPDDRGRIKKGVRDRARELSDSPPSPRPPYLHLIPLGEIVQRVLGTSSPHTAKCRRLYDGLIAAFGTEIALLVDVPIGEIRGVSPAVAGAVDALRSGRLVLHPGGGGRYGSFSFP